jgi:NADH-quinone oxidoreductase subunit L
MPITFVTFAVGWLAIAAVPPLSGFWAKGAVLENAWAAHPALWVVGIITAFLTAYYMSRLTGLAFFGKDRWDKPPIDPDEVEARHAEHPLPDGSLPEPHESKPVMTIPLIVLAVLAAFGGVLATANPHLSLASWVDPVFSGTLYNDHEVTSTLWKLSTLDAVIAVIGVFVGLRLWITRAQRPALESVFLQRSWYLNELYDTVIGRPGARLAQFTAAVVDAKVIDGAVNGLAGLTRRSGSAVRKLQSGYVRNYALWIVVGIVGLLAFMLTRMWWG